MKAVIKKIQVLIFILLFYSCLFGQKQFSGWLASFNTLKTGKKTSLHFDMQLRTNDEWKQLQTVLLRPGLNYHFAKNKIVTVGYALIENRSSLRGLSKFLGEHRTWEQFIFNHKIKTISTTQRFRIEQRFIKKLALSPNDVVITENYFSQRFRYFIRNIILLNKKQKSEKGFFAALQNETFVNITGKNAVNREFFDQNRLYLAIGYRINKQWDAETGYMNQYINGVNTSFVKNHILQFAVYKRL
jgi:hypothetical protein